MTLPPRFWAKVDVPRDPEACWDWTGAVGAGGYGNYVVDGRREAPVYANAHRVSWEDANGPVPDGLVLDHRCRRRLCVRPSHLEPVTQATNVARGRSAETLRGRAADNAARTACIRGHPFAGDNLVITKAGRRECRTCRRLRDAKYRDRLRTRHSATGGTP